MTAVNEAFHGLRHMIASGQLKAGQRFPPEGELCHQLGVSRGSLREAVRMLSALGVIESRHGSGTYVSQLKPEQIVGSLALTVDLLPLDGLLDMYEMRRVLEAHSAAQAAARSNPVLEGTLTRLLEAMEATDDPETASEFDAQFHAAIAEAAGNPTMMVLLEVFRGRSRAYQIFEFPEGPEIKRVSDAGHRAIADAILSQDPAAASAAAASHVAQTEVWLRRLKPAPKG